MKKQTETQITQRIMQLFKNKKLLLESASKIEEDCGSYKYTVNGKKSLMHRKRRLISKSCHIIKKNSRNIEEVVTKIGQN